MHNLMLDIETLGTDQDAIVIAIGAQFFNPETGQLGASFYRKLNFQDQIDMGRKPTQSTIEFWLKQSKEAQAVFHEEGIDTSDALDEFVAFISNNSEKFKCKPWGNGPSFDLTIMETLLNTFRGELPWMFFNVRCLRTFKEYIYDGKDLTREGVYHHALDDCKHQIKIVSEGMKRKQREVQNG